ncbi:MAG: hypothetical protein ACTSSB_00315 [Candidatus Heimdallarchaeota archaeon]
MTEETTKCEMCGVSPTIGDVYCNKCGNILPKENWDNRVKDDPLGRDYQIEYTSKQKVKKKWYKPPKRTRPAFHPLECFFWIGWGFYVFFGFIFLAIWRVLKELVRYLLWCCYWGPPRDMKNDE